MLHFSKLVLDVETLSTYFLDKAVEVLKFNHNRIKLTDL